METPCPYPARMRLTRASDFSRVYRTGNRAKGAFLTVVAAENGLEHPRLGLSVGKRVCKRAVRRNRVRRLFREAFRLSQHELPAGMDLILIATLKDLEPTLTETRKELVRLARKAAARYLEKVAKEQAG